MSESTPSSSPAKGLKGRGVGGPFFPTLRGIRTHRQYRQYGSKSPAKREILPLTILTIVSSETLIPSVDRRRSSEIKVLQTRGLLTVLTILTILFLSQLKMKKMMILGVRYDGRSRLRADRRARPTWGKARGRRRGQAALLTTR